LVAVTGAVVVVLPGDVVDAGELAAGAVAGGEAGGVVWAIAPVPTPPTRIVVNSSAGAARTSNDAFMALLRIIVRK
jgi:hypothetical protein